MMDNSKNEKSNIELAGENLFNFAIDRRDVKALMSHLPKISDAVRATIEHELQILKIISVGWSLSYYLEDGSQKGQLTALYWQAVHDFSKSLSQTTELLIHEDIKFFETVKERFDAYLQKMQKNPDAPEPAVVIGPEFSRVCGDADDVHTVMAGSKMFISTVGEVKAYLEEIKLR
jgi:hypothetical protein